MSCVEEELVRRFGRERIVVLDDFRVDIIRFNVVLIFLFYVVIVGVFCEILLFRFDNFLVVWEFVFGMTERFDSFVRVYIFGSNR